MIVVVFGGEEFGIDHGSCVNGTNDDRLYFANDQKYEVGQEVLDLPVVNGKTMLAVMLHKSSTNEETDSQIKWLDRLVNYESFCVDKFSHFGEPFETIKNCFKAAEPEEVSRFIESKSNRMVFMLLDKLSAWNTLYICSGKEKYIEERQSYIDKTARFLPSDVNLNRLPAEKYEADLANQAAKFC